MVDLHAEVLREMAGVDDRPPVTAVGRAVVSPAPPPPPAPPPAPVPPPPPPPPVLHPLVGRHPRGDTPQRAVGRVVRRALGATASADLHGAERDLHQVVRPVTTCRRVMVAAVRGGAGASTLAALLSLAYAGHRRDRTLLMDATTGCGSLAFRIGGSALWPYHELVELSYQPDPDRTAALLRARGPMSVMVRPPGEPVDAFWTISAVLTRFAGVAVIDGGNGALRELGYVEHAHALVLAIPATVDGVRTGLAWLAEARPEVRARTVPVLVSRSRVTGLRQGAVLRAMGGGVPATWLAYDRSLATGAPLRPRRLSQATVDTVRHVAGAALTVACGHTWSR
jgi:hypothetical protein